VRRIASTIGTTIHQPIIATPASNNTGADITSVLQERAVGLVVEAERRLRRYGRQRVGALDRAAA
jgi:hypothetical protein